MKRREGSLTGMLQKRCMSAAFYTGISVGRGVMCGVWSDASLYHSTDGLAPAKHIVHAVIFGELESYLNNYILMATSMKCDNILIMNNSCNWFGRTQEDTGLHPAIIIMHTGVSLTSNILVFRYNVGLGRINNIADVRQ